MVFRYNTEHLNSTYTAYQVRFGKTMDELPTMLLELVGLDRLERGIYLMFCLHIPNKISGQNIVFLLLKAVIISYNSRKREKQGIKITSTL